MWLWILIALGALLVWFWLARSNELFVLSVRDGQVLLVRGRITQALFNDLAAAVSRPPVGRGTVRAVKTGGGLQLYGRGEIDEFLEQRLRNILRIHPQAALRSAPGPVRPTLGQILGIAWLAWLLDRRG